MVGPLVMVTVPEPAAVQPDLLMVRVTVVVPVVVAVHLT